ncbi:MAG: phosphotransferase enzyme family protein [Spirochaetota bacterium]|nr:phosphotransferase enzyme family protein [Spirochaetota bacterium]
MTDNIEQNLINLFEDWCGDKAIDINLLPQSGSYRMYYRISNTKNTAIAAYNNDRKENIAFLTFSKHFHKMGLSVPEVYKENIDNNIYLVQDLGDTTLFSYLTEAKKDGNFPDKLIQTYKDVINELPKFQILASKNLNYKVCYPRSAFDKQSMLWDLSYFKYYFLKLAKIPFDEQDLEDDFNRLTGYLLQVNCDFFLYRDFQSLNIMIYNDKPYFIDFQGGRKGALHYDIASLLFDSKADIPNDIRIYLLEHYIETVNKIIPTNREDFIQYFYAYSLIRIMQAMGAYGFRGFYEKKKHFLESIPYAINDLKHILKVIKLPIDISHLIDTLKKLIDSKKLKKYANKKILDNTLTIRINSFSYLKGIPISQTDNSGLFVFDCRAIHNPAKYDEFKHLTGKDKKLIDFFLKESDIDDFLNDVYSIIDLTIEKYQEKRLTDLAINFGCIGGKHRSVYCAESLSNHIKNKFNVNIILQHIEL